MAVMTHEKYLPDLRIEYETPDGRLEHRDLELVTEHYSRGQLAGKTRAGFAATGRLNRQDFGVSWNSTLDRGGVVVGDDIDITIDAEAILEKPGIAI